MIFSIEKLALAATIVALSTGIGPASAQAGSQAPESTVIVEGTFGYGDLFPDAVPGAAFIMPIETFRTQLAESGLSYQANKAETKYLVNTPDQAFTGVKYDFSSDLGEILTEIEIRFADEAAAKAWFSTAFTPASNGEYNAYNQSAGYRVNAWQFSNKVFFVAVLANTRWANQ